MQSNYYRHAKGFTLIEVLIASIILFLFLAIASQAFSQSAVASEKAERAAKVAALLPLLTDNIRAQMVLGQSLAEQNGGGELFEMHYQWQAQRIERRGAPKHLDPAVDGYKTYPDRFNLWQVAVTITVKSYQRTWQYKEITWDE